MADAGFGFESEEGDPLDSVDKDDEFSFDDDESDDDFSFDDDEESDDIYDRFDLGEGSDDE